MLLTTSSPVAFLTTVLIIVAFRECSAATTLAISTNGFQEPSNLDTLVALGASVSFTCNNGETSAAGDLYFNDAATTLPRVDDAWIITSMWVEHQGAYKCCVESLCEEIAVISELNALWFTIDSLSSLMANPYHTPLVRRRIVIIICSLYLLISCHPTSNCAFDCLTACTNVCLDALL